MYKRICSISFYLFILCHCPLYFKIDLHLARTVNTLMSKGHHGQDSLGSRAGQGLGMQPSQGPSARIRRGLDLGSMTWWARAAPGKRLRMT